MKISKPTTDENKIIGNKKSALSIKNFFSTHSLAICLVITRCILYFAVSYTAVGLFWVIAEILFLGEPNPNHQDSITALWISAILAVTYFLLNREKAAALFK